MRQAADEADRVGDEVLAAVVLEAARRRVEGLEETVVHRGAGAGEGVQERRLADVRVAGERDRRRLGAPPRLAAGRALLAELLQPRLEQGDPAARQAAVGLELRLAGAARPDAAAEALEVLPHAPHPRQVVLELRELDLELALGAPGVLGEDVEDQLRAVDHARLEQVLQAPLLGRVELVVDEQRLGARLGEGVLQLLELPLADVGRRIRAHARLDERRDGVDAGRPRQLADLGELFAGIGSLRQDGDDEPSLRFRPGGGIGLAMRHGAIMTPREPPGIGPAPRRSGTPSTGSGRPAPRRDGSR